MKLGAVAGYNGEAVRSIDLKFSRRSGVMRTFVLNGKIGRDTPLTAELRGRGQPGQGRDLIVLQTNDAGAFFRFNDIYSKMIGGQMTLAVEPPTADSNAREGLLNVRDFTVKGQAELDRIASGGGLGAQSGVQFSALRAEFTRQNGQFAVRDGVAKGPMVGGTIEGTIDAANQVRMSGTFVPMYGLNNLPAQIPIVGLFLGGGSNEGLFGVTYEVVGTLGQPVLRINPISAILPGVTRKIMDFNTGKQYNPSDFPSPNN
jgi:hypothetical protein